MKDLIGKGNISSIKSLKNLRIKALTRLRKKHYRDKVSLIVIEGKNEVIRAIEGKVEIEEVYYQSASSIVNLTGSPMKRLEDSRTKFFEVSDRVFEKISYRAGSSVVIAVAKRPERSLKDMPSGNNNFYIVMDDVEKPGNLGAVLRSADGAGVTGVIASDERTDLYNPNVIRASLGTIFTVPTVVSKADEAIRWLRSKDVQIVVTTPSVDILYTETDLTGPTAIVVGSEDRGTRQEWLEAADQKVSIPMRGAADSLNVAQAATILMYEALRQRSAVGE